MLNKSRTVAFGVLTALIGALAAPGQKVDNDWQAESNIRAKAGAGGGYTLSWFTVDGGGGTSSGGGFVMRCTIGQYDAGQASGGGFEMNGGFQQPPAAPLCGECPTDADGNGDTGPFDLALLLGSWGPCTPGDPCECLDADDDGLIAPFDLAFLLGAWGPCE